MSTQVASTNPELKTLCEKLNRRPGPDEAVPMFDASEILRPDGKAQDQFRFFNPNPVNKFQERLRDTYLKMHTYQTVDFVRAQKAYWCKFDKFEMTILEALAKLNSFVDEADSDLDIPNAIHAFQTAEGIRKVHPDEGWFQLTGLIHDVGKVMGLTGNHPHWACGGDTYPVGCQFADSIVYRETSFNSNPDLTNPRYNTKYGIYEPNCGLDNVLISWGHDEYMYQVLKNHKTCTLPEEALYMIRFHSFYPWHTDGDYNHLCSKKDMDMLPWIREFNRFDLYTKCEESPNMEELVPYYQSLCDKYIPGKVKF